MDRQSIFPALNLKHRLTEPFHDLAVSIERAWLATAILLCLAFNATAQEWKVSTAPNAPWTSICCSADGDFVLAAAGAFTGNSPLYLSRDSGATWADSGAPSLSWSGVACSADADVVRAALLDVRNVVLVLVLALCLALVDSADESRAPTAACVIKLYSVGILVFMIGVITPFT